ncbi:MAG: hypothetical protein WCH62_08015, partial [Candidatus Omnitrophota bacterium]
NEAKVVVSSVYPVDEQKERIIDADAYFDKSDGINVLLQTISSFTKVDVNKLEVVICMEGVLDSCYQSISHLIHNQTIRNECQRFRCRAKCHQEELRRQFLLSKENEIAIESKINKYLLLLDPKYLQLDGVLNLSVRLTSNKKDIYEYLSRTSQEHYASLSKFVKDSVEEMDFLQREISVHQRGMVKNV